MKVLLLNPLYRQSLGARYERYFVRSGSRWPHSGVKLKGAIPHYRPFPFSLAYAAAYLKTAGFDPWVIDAVALNTPEELLLQQVGEINPDVVFYEFTTLTIEQDLSLAKKIKEFTNALVVAGGAHAAYFACEIIDKHKVIDFIIRGNYEFVLSDLILALKKKEQVEIAGVVYSDHKTVVDHGYPRDEKYPEHLISPLRSIFPANDRPDPTIYWDGFCQYRRAIQMQSSRGCKYGCTFCLSSRQDGSSGGYRVASAQQIGDELQEALRKYNIREVYFDDDNFTQDMRHVESIFESLRERGLRIKWSGMASLFGLTPSIIKQLAGYGCIGLKLGVESASPRVLEGMDKPVGLKNVAGIISTCRRYRIKTHLTFSIGFLDESLEDINQTVSYALSSAADSIQVSIATPLPGTEFFKQAKAQNRLSDAGWEKYDGKRTSVIRFSNFDPQRLSRIRKILLRSWFIHRALSPYWLIAHLPVILRTLRGVGFILFFQQLIAVFIDENKNN